MDALNSLMSKNPWLAPAAAYLGVLLAVSDEMRAQILWPFAIVIAVATLCRAPVEYAKARWHMQKLKQADGSVRLELVK